MTFVSVVALTTLSPLAAVVRFSSGPYTWDARNLGVFRLWNPCWCDVCTALTLAARSTRRRTLQGSPLLPKRRRGRWPVGSICHNSASENTSSDANTAALAAAGSTTKASLWLLLSFSLSWLFSLLRSLIVSHCDLFSLSFSDDRTTNHCGWSPDDLLRTHTGGVLIVLFLSHNKDCDNAWWRFSRYAPFRTLRREFYLKAKSRLGFSFQTTSSRLRASPDGRMVGKVHHCLIWYCFRTLALQCSNREISNESDV